MASGSRRSRGSDEYIFIDGKAMRAEEAVRIEVDAAAVPGQNDAAAVGPVERSGKKPSKRTGIKESLEQLGEEDAFALREDAAESIAGMGAGRYFESERRTMRRKYLVFGIVLFAVVCLSLCISEGYSHTFYSPAQVARCVGAFFYLHFVQLTDAVHYAQVNADTMAALPMYVDVLDGVVVTLKYLLCGALLAMSGMLYQNTFRNPIAAPSMLGVSSGTGFALLILVLQYGYAAQTMNDLYVIYSFAGGVAILALVILGGRWISGKGNFNVVNVLLMGTIVSQLLGVIIQWVENMVFSDAEWFAFYQLQTASQTASVATYVTLFIGFAASIVPVVVLRFRLNLVSFDDAETRVLGVDPNKLRILALACGSLMILTAQINAGQVAMLSLVVPFVSRAVFGAEFRKQLVGNLLLGSIVLLLCGDVVSFLDVTAVPLNLGSVVTILALPMFVWMLVIQQKSWR